MEDDFLRMDKNLVGHQFCTCYWYFCSKKGKIEMFKATIVPKLCVKIFLLLLIITLINKSLIGPV